MPRPSAAVPRADSGPAAAAAPALANCSRELPRLRRTTVALAGVSAMLHLLMIGHGSVLAGLLMVGMAALCLPCAVHLWQSATVRAWTAVGAMNAAMLIMHGWMVRSAAGGHAAVEMPAGSAEGSLTGHEVLMLSATALSGAEVVLAGVGLVLGASWRRRAASRAR